MVIAYSTCIAHGIDMSQSMTHQKDAVRSGYWPLYRYSPLDVEHGTPFKLDSAEPAIKVSEFIGAEARFAVLARTNPQQAAELAVGAPVKGLQVADGGQAAKRAGNDVVDLPAILALRSMVRPGNDVPIPIDAVVGGVMALEGIARRPGGELLLFAPR